MRTMLIGEFVKGTSTIFVERKAGDQVKKSYVNLRGKGKISETLKQYSEKEALVSVTGQLEVEEVNGLNAPFIDVQSVISMPSGTPHMSIVSGIGNVVNDAEIRRLENGWKVLGYRFASNRKIGNDQKTSFFTISQFAKDYEDGGNRLVNLAPHVTKGKGLSVWGRLDVQIWDGEDGRQFSAVNIILDDFEFLPGGKKQEGQEELPPYAKPSGEQPAPAYVGQEASAPQQGSLPEIDINEDEIPF